MRDPQRLDEPSPPAGNGYEDLETVPTSRADLESAGRSCMAIVVMVVVILILLVVWLALHAVGVAG